MWSAIWLARAARSLVTSKPILSGGEIRRFTCLPGGSAMVSIDASVTPGTSTVTVTERSLGSWLISRRVTSASVLSRFSILPPASRW